MERDRLSGDLAQLSCELLLLRRGEGYGGDGRHLQNAVIPVIQFGKSVTAVGKVADIAPFRQDFHKIQNIGMHRAAEAGVQNPAPLRFGKAGVGEQTDKIRLFTEAFLQDGQLLPDFPGQPLVLCKLVQGLTVDVTNLCHF